MRVIIVLLIGCLPLTLLTVSTLLNMQSAEANGGATEGGEHLTSEEQENASKLVGTIAAVETADQQPILKLLEWNLVSREVLPELEVAPETAVRYEGLETNWADIRQAQDVIKKYSQIYASGLPDDEQAKLTALLNDDSVKTLKRGDDLVRHINDRLRELTTKNQNMSLLAEAETLYKVNKQYDGCIEKLDEIDVELLNEEDQERVKKLYEGSKFWGHWKTLPAFGESKQAQLNGLKEHLRTSPKAPDGDTDAADRLEKKNDEVAKLTRQIRIAEFLAETPEELRDFLEEAQVILADDADAGDDIRKAFSDWLKSKLPMKKKPKPDDDPDLKRMVVQLENGTRLYGVFEEANKGAPPAELRYRYWKDVKKFPANDAWETRYRSQFKGEPQHVIDEAGFDSYTNLHALIEKALESQTPESRKIRRHWEDFKELCERLNTEQAERDPSFEDLDYDAEIEVASDILDRWTQVEEILKK